MKKCRLLWSLLVTSRCTTSVNYAAIQPQTPQYRITVAIAESSVVHVHLEMPAARLAGIGRLDLRFRDLRRQPGGLRSFHARIDQQPLRVLRRAADSTAISVELGDATGLLVIEYDIDPTFFPPGSDPSNPRDARSRIARDFAVLRSSTVIPALDSRLGPFTVTLALPDGWSVAAPWTPTSGGWVVESQQFNADVDYIALGKLRVEKIELGPSSITIASAGSVPRAVVDGVRHVLTLARDHLGPLQGAARQTVVIVPDGFVDGGAAGAHSTVQTAAPPVMVHELLHWWNGAELTTADAAWFREGVTNHLAIEWTTVVGLWTRARADSCLGDLQAEMRLLEADQAVSLAAAARRSVSDQRMSRIVYSKGTLFARYLDRTLTTTRTSVASILRAARERHDAPLHGGQLQALVEAMAGQEAAEITRRYVVRGERLPHDAALPKATGRSGCARFLPAAKSG